LSHYDHYEYLSVAVDDGLAEITIQHPHYDSRGHWELGQIWRDIDDDIDVRAALLLWKDPPAKEPVGELLPGAAMPNPQRFAVLNQRFREARAAVENVIACQKLIVAAATLQPLGACLGAFLMADISIIAEDVTINDKHVDIGVAAGDCGAYLPLLIGVAKTRLILLGGELIDGREADRLGLVSRAVPSDRVVAVGRAHARRLADGAQNAARLTKRSINQWVRQATPSFDFSLLAEQMNFFDGDFDAAMHQARETGELLRDKQGVPNINSSVKRIFPSVTTVVPSPSRRAPGSGPSGPEGVPE
jgi:enoyl-CoA hydratase